MRKPNYKPLHAGQVLREFAKCFKDKKLRVRYPYAMIEGDTIIATDSYIILKYRHHMSIIDSAAYVKLDHATQFSTKDDLIFDGEHLQGTASGLIIPAHLDSIPLFDNIKNMHSREFVRLISNPEPISKFTVTSELLCNVMGVFDRLSFEIAELLFDTAERPMGISSTRHYYQSGSMTYSELQAIVNWRKEN